MKTIKKVEEQIEERIAGVLRELNLLPGGYEVRAGLCNSKSRKKRGDAAFEKHWSPDRDSIRIEFRRTSQQAPSSSQVIGEGRETNGDDNERHTAEPGRDEIKRLQRLDPRSELIQALDRAESRPGYSFVALKWFRDSALPAEGFPWASEDSQRRTVLGDAIDKRLILTSKMPNPRSAQFPVTAIRLNRLSPEVKGILGIPGNDVSGFKPIPIRGETLSATVLRDRR